MIKTVTGTLDASRVRRTLSHEHCTFGNPGMLGDEASPYQRDVAYRNGLRMMKLVTDCDVNLLVDATTIEHGRDPELLVRLSRDTGVGIVCCTGFFKDEDDALALLKARSYTSDLVAWMRDLFIGEIQEGIGDTGVAAGALKVATSLGEVKPLERAIMQAAAAAQRATGVPLLTHCDRGTMATAQADLLEGFGADPARTIIGHMTSNRDLDEIKRLIERGFYVAFDQFGILSIPGIPDDEEKAANLLALVRAGCAQRIVLSHDVCFDRMGYVSKSKPRYPDMVYKRVVPYLLEQGVSERDVMDMTRDNLLRVFNG